MLAGEMIYFCHERRPSIRGSQQSLMPRADVASEVWIEIVFFSFTFPCLFWFLCY